MRFMGPLIGPCHTTAVRRGWPPMCFRTSRRGRRDGPRETDARRTPSIPRWPWTSRVAHTRIAPTAQPWCSIPFLRGATPGQVAGRCRNGLSAAPATALTRRARCGRSFVSIRCEGLGLQYGKTDRPPGAPRFQTRQRPFPSVRTTTMPKRIHSRFFWCTSRVQENRSL